MTFLSQDPSKRKRRLTEKKILTILDVSAI
jgi:hypothetical protein